MAKSRRPQPRAEDAANAAAEAAQARIDAECDADRENYDLVPVVLDKVALRSLLAPATDLLEALQRHQECRQAYAGCVLGTVADELPLRSAWSRVRARVEAVRQELARLGLTKDQGPLLVIGQLEGACALRTSLHELHNLMAPTPDTKLGHPEQDLSGPLARVEFAVEAIRRLVAPEPLPGGGLEIIPGGIRYGEATVDLSGKPLACIGALLDAHHHRLQWQDLRNWVWGKNAYTDEGTIKNAIKDARHALRKLARRANLPIDGHFDPLPCVDIHPNLAWRLAFPR
jgi:hypothetical protein